MREPELVSFENNFLEDHNVLSSLADNETEGAIACVTIDGFPADENQSGTVIAKVWMTKARQIIIDWHHNGYRMNARAIEKVNEAKETLHSMYPECEQPSYHPQADTILSKLKEAEELLQDMSGKAPGHYTVECYIRDIGRSFHSHHKNYEDALLLAQCLMDRHKIDGCFIVEDDTRRMVKLFGYCGY